MRLSVGRIAATANRICALACLHAGVITSTTTNDPTIDLSTISFLNRVFQILVKTILMVFGVVFFVISAVLLIGLIFLAVHKIRIYWQFREFQIAERRRRDESLNDILMSDFLSHFLFLQCLFFFGI
ncbi:hypothetical protein B9Z55_027997 [Caenorhabditis nigoni]|uniref:Uncharacterized protein n=1 Tax=Caenorhabditis nigoni TaxID=1611254 RepID=A0A2G5SDP3_9PELO|nr:hypothetical protein B9Z55_027997 [Caenorhabditis nigoni]